MALKRSGGGAPSSGGSGALKRVVAGGNIGATATLAMLPADGEVMFTGTLTANATVTVTGLLAGQSIFFELIQDGTGSRTFSITVSASTAAVSINPAAGTYTRVLATYDGTNLYAKGI